MQKNSRRFAYIWFAIFIFVSGMYYDDIRMDSAYRMHMDCQAYITADAIVITEPAVCISEMLGIKRIVGSSPCVCRQSDDRKSMEWGNNGILIILFSFVALFISVREEMIPEKNDQKKCVTQYIQKSDGKKRM